MNRRLLTAIACAIGVSTALLLVPASVPWIEGAASEWTSFGLQQASNRRVLFPQRPVPSGLKQKRLSLRAAAIATPSKPIGPSFLPIVENADITSRHRLLTQKVLTTLPPQCRTHLKNYYVLYENARKRGLGGKTTIILDGSVPDTEFLALLVHECGHVTHANLTGTPAAGESPFVDGHDRFFADSPVAAFFAISWETERVLHERTKTQDFISGYARTNAFEDFAETFATYVLHRDLLKVRAKTNAAIAAKLAWMETHLPLQENPLAVSTHIAGRTIPWDITKLGIEL